MTRIEAFRRGLRDLGYVEGKDIGIEYRYADGKIDRLRALAAELIRARSEILLTTGPPTTRAAKQTTTAIPIIVAIDDNPAGSGFAGDKVTSNLPLRIERFAAAFAGNYSFAALTVKGVSD